MTWLFIIVLAYFFLALTSLIDRYLLAGPLQDPKTYAFFVGILGAFALFLVPFGFEIPLPSQILLSLLAGAVWTLAIFLLFLAIYQSEVSRVVPAIGGLLPIFTFAITQIAFPGEALIAPFKLLSLLLLISGSVLITFEKEKSITSKGLKASAFAALAFAIGFFLMKLVYLEQSFISGFIWMRAGGVMAALLFLVFPETRRAIFKQKSITKKQVSLPLILGQIFGGIGFVLQNLAVAQSEVSQIPYINALEGIHYAFLLFFTLILGRKFPQILKEQISKQTFFQRTFAILLIAAGLILLSFG